MNLSTKIASEIISSNSDMKKLEREFKLLEKKDIKKFSLKQLQIVLAYETWKDGAEWDYVSEIWEGKEYNNKNKIIKELETVYSY